MYDLEKEGGSIIAGVFKQIQRNKANPPPARDSRLPPKPPGQTVGSFKSGLATLPNAIAARLDGKIRCAGIRGQGSIPVLYFRTRCFEPGVVETLGAPKPHFGFDAFVNVRFYGLRLPRRRLQAHNDIKAPASSWASTRRVQWTLRQLCGALNAITVRAQPHFCCRCFRVQWKLREITSSGAGGGPFTLFYDTPDGAQEVRARSVALTVPAYVAAELVRERVPNASDALMCFDYPPVGAVSLSYPLSAIREDSKDASGTLPGAPLGLRTSTHRVYIPTDWGSLRSASSARRDASRAPGKARLC